MTPKFVVSGRTGKKGFEFRFANPRTGLRARKIIWLSNKRDAERGFQTFMDGLEAQRWNLPSNDGWLTPWTAAVTRFLAESDINSPSRRRDLERLLNKNVLGLRALSDLCDLGALTQKAKLLAASGEYTDNYVRASVQQPLKQFSSWAASIGLLPHDPLSCWKMMARTSQRQTRRALWPDEFRALLDAADELDKAQGFPCYTSIIYKTMLLSGNRHRALIAAKVGDLDVDGGRIALPAARWRKSNGMSSLPVEFIEELKNWLVTRGNPSADAPLLCNRVGTRIQQADLGKKFHHALVLCAVRKHWPSDDPLASETNPVAVAEYIHGRHKGGQVPPTGNPVVLSDRVRRLRATAAIAARLGSEVDRHVAGHNLYCLRKTHISWARRLVNPDSVKLQVGHAAKDVEERHYLDLVDPRESSQAVYDVMTGARALDEKKPQVVAAVQNVQSVPNTNVPNAADGAVTQPPAEVPAERKASASATTTVAAGGGTQAVGGIDKGAAVFSPATR